MTCFPECYCSGDGYVERGPTGATYSYPCYPWDCTNPECRCHRVIAADCVNPCCSGGYVPAGEKGDVLCPDCLRENRAKTTPVTMIGGPKP
jgi:hypothetical protein